MIFNIIYLILLLTISGILFAIYKKVSELTDINHDSEIEMQEIRMFCKRILEISLGGKHRRKVKSEYEAQLQNQSQEAIRNGKSPYREIIKYIDIEE